MPESAGLITLKPDEGIFGLPPLNNLYVSKHVVIESMPTAEIIPCEPNFSSGMSLFSLTENTEKYDSILQNLGYKVTHPIKVAFLADNFPTDSFSNDYGETFLQGMTDVGAQKIQEMVQMTGSDTLSGATTKIAEMIKGAGKHVGGHTGSALDMMGSLTNAGGTVIKSLENVPGLGTVGKMLAGHRVDFPNIWKNSGFSPSYSMTVRLFNPCPGNFDATRDSIIGPLAVLLTLATPITKDGNTFRWPFFHKIKCPGVFSLDPAVITNITVIKGGDQQQIGWNQRLGIVDVRIDFGSLYSSMVCEEGDVEIVNRPTLNNYLKVLEEEKPNVEYHYLRSDFKQLSLELEKSKKKEKNNRSSNESLSRDETYIPGPRIPSTSTEVFNELSSSMPNF